MTLQALIDAGASFTDMTYDDADDTQPHGIHPDQHSIVTNPANWKQFIETSDGGVIRSNGNFVDDSGDCTAVRHLSGASLALFRSFPEEAWARRGVASQKEVTARALAFITAGHQMHHRVILEERYFPAIPRA